MIEFVYNNTKNASIDYIFIELNCKYYLFIFFKKDINFYSKSYSAKKQTKKLKNLISIYQQNPIYT